MNRRLFFGLKPRREVRDAIDRASRRRPGFSGRPQHPDDLHLTLLFLGAVEGKLDGLCHLAASVRVPRFLIRLDRFGHWSRSQVAIMEPSRPPAPLFDLVADLRAGAERLGHAVDHRPYRPHVTLARKARLFATGRLERAIEWPVTHFALFLSAPRREPPFYQVLHRWPLVEAGHEIFDHPRAQGS